MPTAESGSRARGPARVEVAVDAAGAGVARGPSPTRVPESLADLEDGEAVLVEFGRRQALGVVLGGADEAPSTTTKPMVDRVRADGPLLPPLDARTGALGRRALPGAAGARHPGDAAAGPAGTPRAGRRADPAAASTGELDAVDADLLDQLGGGARPARDLAAPDGRAGLLRRLRGLASRDLVTLDWTLLGAGAGPRYERWIRLLPAGRAAARRAGGGGAAAGPSAGPSPGRRRSRSWPASPWRPEGVPAADVAGPARDGDPRLPGSARPRRDRRPGTAAPAAGRASARVARRSATVGRALRGAGAPRWNASRGRSRSAIRAPCSSTA